MIRCKRLAIRVFEAFGSVDTEGEWCPCASPECIMRTDTTYCTLCGRLISTRRPACVSLSDCPYVRRLKRE